MGALTCNDCQHYSAMNQQCRRNPPVPVIIGTNQQGQPAVAGMWPAVQSSDWCGEFHRAEYPSDTGGVNVAVG